MSRSPLWNCILPLLINFRISPKILQSYLFKYFLALLNDRLPSKLFYTLLRYVPYVSFLTRKNNIQMYRDAVSPVYKHLLQKKNRQDPLHSFSDLYARLSLLMSGCYVISNYCSMSIKSKKSEPILTKSKVFFFWNLNQRLSANVTKPNDMKTLLLGLWDEDTIAQCSNPIKQFWDSVFVNAKSAYI